MSHVGHTTVRALRVVGFSIAAALVAFHGWLLLSRIARSDFGWVDLLRWLAALAVVGAIREVYRRSGGLHGRQAVVLGLLVVALHVGVTQAGVDPAQQEQRSGAVFLLPVAIAPTAGALLLLCFIAGLGNPPSWGGPGTKLALVAAPVYTDRAVTSLFSRPPPR